MDALCESTQHDSKTTLSVLYVEDDAADVALLQSVLSRDKMTDYSVTVVGSVNAAETQVSSNSKTGERFDVILLDLSLPDAQDLQAIERLHLHCLNAPIIVITGNSDQTLAINALNRGAQDYLVKGSYTLETLSRTIKYAVERSQHQQALHDLAHTDALTQLPNRLNFSNYLDIVLARARRQQIFVSVLFIDLDKFKLINDVHGHQAGDRFLQEVAARLQRKLRSSDYIARLGGDEFVVVIEHSQHWLNGVITVLDSLIASLAVPFVINDKGQAVQSSSSIGVAEFHKQMDNSDAEALCHRADVAMYRAKKKGGNCYQFYDQEIEEEASQRIELVSGLETALQQKQFKVFYQPIISAADNSCIGVEALLRWHPNSQQSIPPADFIPLLEETNKIIEVGEWFLRQACLDHHELVASGSPAAGRISVNVSPSQFLRSDFLHTVKRVIADTDIEPACLQLEITETMQIDQPDRMIATLKQLKDVGVLLAIDDFGTGFSSMKYLKEMPVDTIKIDRSFIQSYLSSRSDRLIVDAMISLGKKLGKEIIIEGVETKRTADALCLAGCSQFQGLYFARPMPLEDLLTQSSMQPKSAPVICGLRHGKM